MVLLERMQTMMKISLKYSTRNKMELLDQEQGKRVEFLSRATPGWDTHGARKILYKKGKFVPRSRSFGNDDADIKDDCFLPKKEKHQLLLKTFYLEVVAVVLLFLLFLELTNDKEIRHIIAWINNSDKNSIIIYVLYITWYWRHWGERNCKSNSQL